jgi:hypothetical protein
VYITLFVTLALTTLRNGHYFLFWIGIIFPLVWIIGAVMGPAGRADARGVSSPSETLDPKGRRPCCVYPVHATDPER